MADSMTFNADPSRAEYDVAMYQLNQLLHSGQPIDTYENVVDKLVGSYPGVSPQEIGDTVYNMYSMVGPAPSAKYYGGYVQPTATETGTGTLDGGTTGGTGGTTPPTAEALAAALEIHNKNVKSINDAYNAGLFDFDMKEKALKQNIEDIKTNMVSQQGSNEAYFSNVSPDVFQSQQGKYNQKILDEYERNNSNLTDQGTAIGMAKGQFQTAQENAMYSENLFNPTTGAYDAGGGAYKDGTLQANVPTLTPVSMSQVGAKLGVPTWAPNYGGLSVQQKQIQDQSEIDKYLSGK